MSRVVLSFILKRLGWGWLPSALFQYRRRMRASVWTEAPGAVVLDIGGGTGLTALEKAAAHRDTVFIVLDYDREELRKGQRLALDLGLANIQWVQGDARWVPLQAASVDTIIAANILLEFAPRVAAVLADWKTHLKQGALVLVETPVAPQQLILFNHRWVVNLVRSSIDPRHGFSLDEIQGELRQCGLRPVRYRLFFHGAGVLARELYYLAMCIHPALSSCLWLPLYLLLLAEGRVTQRGNAAMIAAVLA